MAWETSQFHRPKTTIVSFKSGERFAAHDR
jgi:hypothetical protein